MHMNIYATGQGEERDRRPPLYRDWDGTAMHITHIHPPDGSETRERVAAAVIQVRPRSSPVVSAAVTPRLGGEDQGHKEQNWRVPVSNFRFHWVLGIRDSISQQIMKCNEVCFSPLNQVRAAFWKVLILIINTSRSSLEWTTLLCRVCIFCSWQSRKKSLVFTLEGQQFFKYKNNSLYRKRPCSQLEPSEILFFIWFPRCANF